jgi:chromodomain-helicase-DNA-binding protein 4
MWIIVQFRMSDSDHDVEKLIEKTENEGDQTELPKEGGMAFSFAKVWAADKDTLEDIEDTALENPDQADSWAQTLQRIELERQKEKKQEITGRGARRRATAMFPQVCRTLSTALLMYRCLYLIIFPIS